MRAPRHPYKAFLVDRYEEHACKEETKQDFHSLQYMQPLTSSEEHIDIVY